MPALIYIPSGTYMISSTIQLFVDTQMIGDAIEFPTLKATSNVTNGTVVVSGFDPGQGSTTNFYIGIRNINVDTTSAAPSDSKAAGCIFLTDHEADCPQQYTPSTGRYLKAPASSTSTSTSRRTATM